MDRPYLRLAPFKIEILRFNPLAVLFRGVISDDEVATIQGLARPKVRYPFQFKTLKHVFS